MADGAVFDTYGTHVQERQRLQAEIDNAGDEDDRKRLMNELAEVDRRVREQLAAQN